MTKIQTTVCLALVAALCPVLAEARWSPELTSHLTDNTDKDGNGYEDCAGGQSNGVNTPGRPAGGWFESRFMSQAADGKFFQALGPADATRACPRTFNEYTMNHAHGVMNAKIASYAKRVFAVYDSIGGYFWANKIKLQQDPTSAMSGSMSGANYTRPYTVLELARNPRNYVDTNPGSSTYDGAFPNGNGCQDSADSEGRLPNGRYVDKLWAFDARTDHEGTRCAPPATIQTFDPDIDIDTRPGGKTLVAWTERYVEGKRATSLSPVIYGLDPRFPVEMAGQDKDHDGNIGEDADWFPFRGLQVHVQEISSSDLVNGRENVGVPNNALTEDRGLRNATDETYQALSPRLTQVTHSGAIRPVVAWVETFFTRMDGDHSEQIYGTAPNRTASLYVRRYDSFVAESPLAMIKNEKWTALGTSVGNVCNIQEVSSGRATGRKRVFTGTHDIAAITNGGVEAPIVAYTRLDAGVCKMSVARWNGTSWTLLGADLRVRSGTPSWPRITVHANVPYVTWVESDSNGVNHAVYVKRLRNNTGAADTWDQLGGAWNDVANTSESVRGPSIAVSAVAQRDTTADDGANVYVSMNDGKYENYVSTYEVKVKRCTTKVSSTGVFSCRGVPESYNEQKVHRFSSGSDLAVYEQKGHLGISWGQAIFDNPPATGGASASQLHSYQSDGQANRPGPTDMAIDGITPDGRPDAMYLSYVGAIQDHRHFDQGLYVRKDSPVDGERDMMAQGANFSLHARTGLSMFSLSAWGSNQFGQLGIGTTGTTEMAPKKTTLAANGIVKLVAGGAFAGALTSDGSIYLWGHNAYGQLCDGTTNPRATPAISSGTSKYVDIALGASHVLGVREDGTIWACGYGLYGQLGNNAFTSSVPTWVQVKSTATTYLANVVAVYAGSTHSCGLRADATVWCWGKNDVGQLGRGPAATATKYATAAQIVFSKDVAQVALGENHGVLLAADGTVASFGDNDYGQLALATPTASFSTPAQVGLPAASTRAVAVYASDNNTFVRTDNDSIYGAGSDNYGTMGVGSTVAHNNELTYVTRSESLFASQAGNHVFKVSSLTSDDERQYAETLCWGLNTNGQCGNGTTDNIFVGKRVVNMGDGFACASSVTQFDYYGGTFDTNMTICGGAVAQSNSAALCAVGYTRCSALQWNNENGGRLPRLNAWTSDTLLRSGTASGACYASTSSGVGVLTGGMRVCSGSTADPLGNTCGWSGCMFGSNVMLGAYDNDFLGGNNTTAATAGALCCKM